MRITTTVTEIECNADELRQSNSLADAFTGILRRCFNGIAPENYEYEDDEEPEEEEEEEEEE